MSNRINNTWVKRTGGVPAAKAESEIGFNGLWYPANVGPVQGSLAFRMKGTGHTCQVIVRDHAGQQMGDTIAVTDTKKLLTDGGSASAWWLLGEYYLDVTGLTEGTEVLIAEEIG